MPTRKLKSPLTTQEWQTEIENGLEYRRMFAKEESWDILEATYLNDPNSFAAIGPNLIFSMGDSLLSQLIVPDPEFLVKPRNQEAILAAKLNENQANTFVKTTELKKHVEMALLHAYLYGKGILKLGYDSEFGWDPEWDLGGPFNPSGFSLTQFNKKGTRIESGLAKPGQPWVRAIDPHDIVVPWGTTDLETAPWIAHRVVRLNKDLKQDPKYKNTSRLQPSISMENYMSTYYRTQEKRRLGINNLKQFQTNSDEVFNELWEIHDQRTGRMYVISPDYDKFLRDSVDSIQTIGMPFVAIDFVRHPRTFWVTPQAYYLLQIQATQFDIAKQAEKQRRLNVTRFLMQENAMAEDEAVKLTSGDVGAIAKVKGGRPLDEVFKAFPQQSNFPLIEHAEYTRKDARDAIGMSRNQMGEFDKSSRRTAAEASIVQSGAQNRSQRRIDAMLELYNKTMKKILGLVSQFWVRPQTTKLEDNWVFFTGHMMKGDVDFDVHLSTKRHESMSDRRLEALQLLAQLSQIPGANIQALQEHVTRVADDPSFASFFVSSAQQQGITQGQSTQSAEGANQLLTSVQQGGGQV